ncbi:MAG: hypothetical protein KGL02_06595, partial [Acidobacteriota bacterium]|nr:hypothetical protein [Acidobacteriota bacterium]
MLRLNKLLLNNDDARAFDAQIEPTDAQRKYLFESKDRIRDHLREGITRASVEVLGMDQRVSPRFRTQGSWSYRTCVQRAHTTQEMDWDFGVYLPVKVFEENHTPPVAAQTYFRLVEGLLEELCKREGWQLDRGKQSCVRVKVGRGAHIDVPLYAAPESQFKLIQERALALAKASTSVHDARYLNESVEFGELVEPAWEDLDDIHLARRDGTWKKSDPEAVSRWFNDRVKELAPFGQQMRRICRYLKAWRDFWWPKDDGPSSVALMIATAQHFKGSNFQRDDLMLEEAVKHLAIAVLSPLREAAIGDGDEDFFGGLDVAARKTVAARAADLSSGIAFARSLAYYRRQDAVEKVQSLLGLRIPSLFDWVETDTSEAEVRATPASRVPPP